MAVIGGTEHRAFLLREVAQILDSVEDGCLRGTKCSDHRFSNAMVRIE